MKTAVITGAGSRRGIGLETAKHLAAAGHAIAIFDIDGEAAKRSADEIATQFAVPTFGEKMDVTNEASVEAGFSLLEDSQLPPIGVLVNNAGITAPTRFLDIELVEWERIFSVNVTGTYLVTRRALPKMKEQGWGRVINLSSVSAQRGGGVFGGTHYSAAKAAVLGLTRALAREVGGFGVTVNAVTPGLIDTDITGGALDPEKKAMLIRDIPVGRNGETTDVAAVITFLASEATGYITGVTYDINGGSHIN